ncbi:MAG: CCA tRNA nucleotidyltransferase [Planctomycetota bacterium]|jgi:tRNA nucleotidyltransferase/poly(A) polymerase|nr:CCA tRNA nucleotidyltransferase [Planctomycetota bacterium]MDP6764046.1 CCA tRNA nucleotidyltransferase [Planctomycetota bacterium]MDP6989949.1 CCA tRNA nucleotidyltransferase [Planctomycetota bacterium]
MEASPLRRPSIEALPPALRAGAEAVARALGAGGFEAWIVGGAVRDLALGREPQDVDMASDARPEEVEALFERSLAVGKAFGTVIVIVGGVEVQVTTFRAEGTYSDGRRPDSVSYGSSVEVDARRRDFTCNAMYLDPLDDRFRDPERGLEDLRRGLLRCVGEPSRRFEEDGLRMVRLGRFCARLGLDPDPDAVSAASRSLDALRGVSGERLQAELKGLLTAPEPARGLRVLEAAGVLGRLLVGLDGPGERVEAVGRLAGPPAFASALAVLLDDGPLVLESLRPSRRLRRTILAIWSVGERLERLLAEGGAGRGERLELMADEAFGAGLEVLGARRPELGDGLAALAAERAALAPEELDPLPWIGSAELASAGLAPGPSWGALLGEALRRQRDGQWSDRDQALAWLRARVAEGGQDGGKTPRKPHESG